MTQKEELVLAYRVRQIRVHPGGEAWHSQEQGLEQEAERSHPQPQAWSTENKLEVEWVSVLQEWHQSLSPSKPPKMTMDRTKNSDT